MKILLLADQAEPTLWEHLDRRKLEGVELVLACGDLPASYLSFLTCFTAAPILYIRGNHDDQYAQNPPEGLPLHRGSGRDRRRPAHPRPRRLDAL